MSNERNKKPSKAKVQFNNIEKVIEAFARMETLLQQNDQNIARMGMDFMILQEYCMSVGGTQEGYLELHKKRIEEAQRMALDQAKMQQDALKAQHPEASGIVDLGGKPMTSEPKQLKPTQEEIDAMKLGMQLSDAIHKKKKDDDNQEEKK